MRGGAGGRDGGEQPGEGQGEWPRPPPPKKVGLYKLRLLGRLVGREEVGEDEKIVVYLAYHDRKGGSAKARKGLTFTLRDKTQNRHFGQLLFVPPSLLIGPVLF